MKNKISYGRTKLSKSIFQSKKKNYFYLYINTGRWKRKPDLWERAREKEAKLILNRPNPTSNKPIASHGGF